MTINTQGASQTLIEDQQANIKTLTELNLNQARTIENLQAQVKELEDGTILSELQFLCSRHVKRIEQLEDMPIKIQVGTDGQIWIDFDAGDGRQAQLNLNNIVLAKPKKGINRGIMLDAIRAALAERNEL